MALPARPFNVYLITEARYKELVSAKANGTRSDFVNITEGIESDLRQLITAAAAVEVADTLPTTVTIA